MAALGATRVTRVREDWGFEFKVGANKHVFGGSLVAIDDTTGLAEPATDATGKAFAGVSVGEAANNPGNAGAKQVRVVRRDVHLFNKANAVQADVGKVAYIIDDQTVDLASVAANDLACGRIVGIEDSSHVWIAIENYC